MDFAKVEDYGVFPWPERLWFVALFLAAAVVVTRYRPAWLRALWLDAWLLAVAWTLLAASPFWPPPLALVEIVVVSGIPTGATALWLARTRRRPRLGKTAAQAVTAPAAYLCGYLAAGVIMMTIWELPVP